MVEGFASRMRRRLAGMSRPPETVDAVDAEGVSAGGSRVDESGPHEDHRGSPRPLAMRAYPGDFPGVPAMHYAPEPDGLPDPGEVVWTWVPFEEDPSLGKDRPVLLVGLDGDWLLGVMLTSRDHDASREREHRSGREWVDVGTGAWDSRGRESEARTDRIVRVDPDAIRREGAVLDQQRFDLVADAIRRTA